MSRLFIDGLEAFQKLATDPSRVDQIFAALSAELRARNVTTIYTAETETLVGDRGGSPLAGISIRGVSSIAENILVMRFVEVGAAVHRLISVLKVRDSRIDNSLRVYEIGQGGLSLEASSEQADAFLREADRRWISDPISGNAPASPKATGD